MAGYTIGGNTVFATTTAQETFSGLNVENQLVFQSAINHFPGDTTGFASGGYNPVGSYLNSIDTFPFSVDGNATARTGTLTEGRYRPAGQSSATDGYVSGGSGGSPAAIQSTIYKFPFSVDSSTTTVGSLTGVRRSAAGVSSTTDGYTAAGFASPANVNTLDKFPFATDSNASDVGDLTKSLNGPAGHSSAEYGWVSGGTETPITSGIVRFPFAADTNIEDIKDMATTNFSHGGVSSDTDGFSIGGRPDGTSTRSTNIVKFSFSSVNDSSLVGELTEARNNLTGISSTSFGYGFGGFAPTASPTTVRTIDKFPYVGEGIGATDVGDASNSNGNQGPAGHQV